MADRVTASREIAGGLDETRRGGGWNAGASASMTQTALAEAVGKTSG